MSKKFVFKFVRLSSENFMCIFWGSCFLSKIINEYFHHVPKETVINWNSIHEKVKDDATMMSSSNNYQNYKVSLVVLSIGKH